ncbi:MAG: L-seryl-tRNA(Sec) selenium transferase [Proteobacteria bacterium]|nr:L-seryl-tRNA(Sec) selenium transferase [Pseudomonadota bacterium]
MRLLKERQELLPVINGTGAVIHTNLGRSVLSKELIESVMENATSYSNLEFSLETGKRGKRLGAVNRLLTLLTGAEAAVVVNNNAAAVLLTLSALAKDQQVIISRGELVEIGGSFRIPEIITASGAQLKEIGTTNRTRIKDYEDAINESTSLLLKVHTSNYQILGFTDSVNTSELAELAEKKGLILVEDVGSGALTEFSFPQLNSDPLIPQVLKEGADIVTFSGDKLMGGPQAGIIIGSQSLLDQLQKHPLYRSLRCGKMTMLLLEQTLLAYLRGTQEQLLPTQKMLNEDSEKVKNRAESIIRDLSPDHYKLVSCESTPGGGALPGKKIESWAIQINLEGKKEQEVLDKLRDSTPPVIARIAKNQTIIDCRTLLEHQIPDLRLVLLDLVK